MWLLNRAKSEPKTAIIVLSRYLTDIFRYHCSLHVAGSAPHVVVDQSDDAEGVPAGCVEEGGRAERQDGHQELLQQVLQRGQVILVSYWSGHHNTPLSLVNV